MRLVWQAPAIAVPWGVGDAVRAGLLVVAAVTLLLIAAVPMVRFLGAPEGVVKIVLSGVLEGMLLLAVWLCGARRRLAPWRALGFQRPSTHATTLALVVLLASIGAGGLYSLTTILLGLNALTPPPLPADLLGSLLGRALVFAVAVILAPLAEETFFRGFLLPVFVERWGFVRGAGFVSAMFAAGHVSPGLLVPGFVSGMLFSWLYYRTHSLWSSWVAHVAQNTLAFGVAVSL